MTGRVLPLLWQFLQPILFLLCFLSVTPGRDTQGSFFTVEDCVDHPAALSDTFTLILLPILASCFSWICQTGRVWFFWLLSYAILLACMSSSQVPFHFVHKHGQWRFKKFFPSAFLLLSSVSLTSLQVVSALTGSPS